MKNIQKICLVILLGVILLLGYGGMCGLLNNDYSGSSAKSFWTIQSGTTLDDSAYAVRVDSNGNIYMSGYTSGSELHGKPISTGGGAFLVKYSSDAVRQWTMISDYGLNSWNNSCLSIDSYGNAYLAYFVDSDPGSFVEKYTSDGVKEWVKPISTTAAVSDIMVDSAGNIYVTGINEVEWTDGGTTYQGYSSMFVAKYNSDMILIWGQTIKSDMSPDWSDAIATDSNGNVYIGGTISGNLGENVSSGENDIFIVKYNSGGEKQWTIQHGTDLLDTIHDIVIDSNDNIYAVGSSRGNLDGNTNIGFSDIIILKYTSDGVRQWTRQLGSSSEDSAYGISLGPDGNLYVAGMTGGGLDGNAFVGGSVGNYFITKYTTDGVRQWTRISGTPVVSPSRFTSAYGVAIDFSGNIYAVGITYGSLDGNTPMGQDDYFVVKYDASGTKQ